MAISGVNPKCYILALFVRDDGARFLLGDDPFEFKDNQLHFQQNTMANDVVEVQGNDGYLLAGQVRRPGTQVFDGYVCNGTNSKEEVEAKRRAFLQFFRRSHFYKVIYVFPNGTAIQRKQGFLVDDPTVQELYQQYPEYHVALNFEDVNYYTYEEDDQGHEIYAKEAIVPLARGGATGGLIWDSYGVVWEDPWSLPLSISGVQFQILNNAGARAPIDNVELYGDTYQQTYSGKNLFDNYHPFNVASAYTWAPTETGGVINRSGSQSGGVRWRFELVEGSYTFKVQRTAGETQLFIATYTDSSYSTLKTWLVNTDKNSQEIHLDVDSPYLLITFLTEHNDTPCTLSEVQLEIGTATAYEPYTNGPAPNPDYPQAVETVTGAQTVTIGDGVISQSYEINLGKNLLGMDNFTGSFSSNQYTEFGNILDVRTRYGIASSLDVALNSFEYTKTSQYDSNQNWKFKNLQPNTNYTVSCNYSITTSSVTQVYLFGVNRAVTSNNLTQSFTTDENGEKEFINQFYGAGRNDVVELTNLMVEIGSTATEFAPYFTPIELCKIGTYQDYIYKSGDDWYVHKVINSYTLTGSESWSRHASSGAFYDAGNSYRTHGGLVPDSNADLPNIISTHFIQGAYNQVFVSGGKDGICVAQDNTSNPRIKVTGITTTTDFKSMITEKRPVLYFPLATPTDTQITDATLVGQLEALDAMKLFIGENNVLVSAPTPNLPATLSFDYYTKFAAIGAEWEEGGTKGATIVDVDAIDNTYPVWELTGPATNPTLSVLTTNTALTYNGTITASQKLVIDMFNKTATLNGTSVIGNISGDFVYMAPGTNRVAYTAGNTDAPDSTIYWQEVVG